MLDKLIKTLVVKSVAKDSIKMAMKNQNDESAVKEKLGVSIDEFMKMDYHEYQKNEDGKITIPLLFAFGII